jgi:hypothetical protein
MPCKDGTNDVELYTSNTTGPILSILDRVTAEPEISRDNLENSLMRNGVLTATGRKQLLNAVYGREPDPSDQKDRRTGFTGSKADKDRFFRHHLGNKVLRGWLPGKKLRMGSGLHYENEGDKNAYVYADIEDEDGKETMVLGQVEKQFVDPQPAPSHTFCSLAFPDTKLVGAFQLTNTGYVTEGSLRQRAHTCMDEPRAQASRLL